MIKTGVSTFCSRNSLILLVEDDLSLSKSVYDFLKSFAQVKQVYDGVEGLYEAELGIYDLILLDLMLPEKNVDSLIINSKGIIDFSGKFSFLSRKSKIFLIALAPNCSI